jgi:hypothetical protein
MVKLLFIFLLQLGNGDARHGSYPPLGFPRENLRTHFHIGRRHSRLKCARAQASLARAALGVAREDKVNSTKEKQKE